MYSNIKSLYIEQYKGFKDFKIELNNKLNVLVGENGTGKTTILEIIYNVLSGNIEYFLDDINFKSVTVELENNDKIKIINNEIYINNEKLNLDNEFFTKQKVIYFPSEVSFKNYEITGPSKLETVDKDITLNADKISKELKQFLVNQKYQDLNDIANGSIENANRINKFKKIYNEFLSDKKFVGIDNDSFEPIFELNDTKTKITIEKLSSGEKQIFYKGGSLIQYGENKEINVLIDEPEISMYPEWQQKILKFYRNINPNAQFIFATHSPHIVSCCKKEEIRVLEKKENMIYVNNDIVNTYGSTNEDILFNIFNLNSVRNLEVEKDLDEYKDLFVRKQLLTEEEKIKMEELKKKLKETDGLSKSDIAILEFESNTNIINFPAAEQRGIRVVCPTQKKLIDFYIFYDMIFLDFLRSFQFVFHLHSSLLCLRNNRPLQKFPPHKFFFISGHNLNILFAVTLFIIFIICVGEYFGTDCIKK